MTPVLDRAFVDRAEELGIKDLLVAFAESLATAKTAASLRVQSSEPGYLIVTLLAKTCTCGTGNESRLNYSLTSYAPLQPHTDECAWSRFVALFADAAVKAKYDQTAKDFREWATAVDKKPDDHPYRMVVAAREFLEQAKKKEKKP
jgi:hypothetical protein